MTTLPEQAAEYVQPSATAGTRELCAEHDAQHLGLAPEREGQPRMMTIIDRAQDDETGHWYSPEAVREMLAAERKRWADLCGDLAAISWAEWDERADPRDQGKALALERVAALLAEPNAELTGTQQPR